MGPTTLSTPDATPLSPGSSTSTATIIIIVVVFFVVIMVVVVAVVLIVVRCNKSTQSNHLSFKYVRERSKEVQSGESRLIIQCLNLS